MLYFTACSEPDTEYSLLAPTCAKYTCEEINNPCLNRTNPVPGCYCKIGFVKNSAGKCVDGFGFCRKCPDDQYYSDFYLAPEITCTNLNPTPNGKIINGCVCRVGYARNCNHCCIAIKDCPKNTLA